MAQKIEWGAQPECSGESPTTGNSLLLLLFGALELASQRNQVFWGLGLGQLTRHSALFKLSSKEPAINKWLLYGATKQLFL